MCSAMQSASTCQTFLTSAILTVNEAVPLTPYGCKRTPRATVTRLPQSLTALLLQDTMDR